MSNIIHLKPQMKPRVKTDSRLSTAWTLRIEDARAKLIAKGRTAHETALNGRALNETLARNLGYLVQARASALTKPRTLIREVFRSWQEEQDPNHERKEIDFLLKKRARWITLEGEGRSPSDDFASARAGFVRLAELIAAHAPLLGLTQQENEWDAVLTLLSGTQLDPNAAGSVQSGLASQAKLRNLLEHLRTAVLDEVPELPWYFRMVSDGGLFHEDLKCSGNGNHFEWSYSSFDDDEWGNLRPKMLAHRADIAEERARIAGVLPNIPIASVVFRGFYPARPYANFDDYQRGVSEGAHQRSETTSLDWRWRLHLALVPIGGVDAADFQFCLIGTPGDDNPLLLSLEGCQWLPPFGASGLVVDLGLTPDDQIARMMSLDSQLWLASSADGRWLLAELESDYDELPEQPPQHLDRRTYISVKSECAWSSTGPSPNLAPKATIIGMLQRHVLTAAHSEQMVTRLCHDAHQRIAVLKAYLNLDANR